MKIKFLISTIFLLLNFSYTFCINSINDSIILGKTFSSTAFYDSHFKHSTFIDCKFTECNLDGSKWDDVNFNKCVLKNSEYVRNINFEDIRFDNCSIIDLSLYKSSINNVYYENSFISELEFNNCVIEKLVVKNCLINSLRLKNSTISQLTIIGGSFDEIVLNEDIGDNIEIGQMKCKDLIFKSGIISRIKLINLELNEFSQIKFIETKVSLPEFSNFILPKIDLTRANIDFKSFQVLADHESDLGIYGKSQAYRNYIEARDSYYLLNKQFQNAGLKESQRSMEYLMNEAYIKSLKPSISKSLYVIWNKHLRGSYGLNPFIVFLTAIKIWILFSLIFIILGQFTNIGWALYLPLNIHGKPLNNTNPRFLNNNSTKFSVLYISYCFLFSLQQLVIPGFSSSGITFFRGIGFAQKFLIPIGIGKLISFLEYALGLLLIFNFIQAFIRTL